MASEEKMKALDAALAQIEKQYGKGSVMKLGDQSANMGIDVVPTGSLSLDLALGLGGMPRGRIIEIYGPESSGKTTVALHVVAEVQKMGGIAGFIERMRRILASILITCIFHSRIMASRHWRLQRRWFVLVRLM